MYSKMRDFATSVKNRISLTPPPNLLNSLLATLCLSVFSTASCAVPYIDKPEVRQDKWNTIAYAKVIWPSENSEEKINCDSFIGCTLKICLREINGNNCVSDMDLSTVIFPKGSTMKQIRELWTKEYGVVSKEFRFKNAFTTKCIIMTGDIWQPLPGMTCRPLVSPAVTCNISDTLDFTYGTLTADQVNNAEAYSTITIACTGKATVELTLAGDRTIDLGRSGTLKASLHTAYGDLANGYSFEGNGMTTNLTIKSVLHSSVIEAEAGPFKGQGIIVMNIY